MTGISGSRGTPTATLIVLRHQIMAVWRSGPLSIKFGVRFDVICRAFTETNPHPIMVRTLAQQLILDTSI